MIFALENSTRYQLTLVVMPIPDIAGAMQTLVAQGFIKLTGQSPLPGDPATLFGIWNGETGDVDLAEVTAVSVAPKALSDKTRR